MSYDDENTQVEDPWANIVDLMSALVLVLFLAVIFFIMNYSTINDQLKVEHQNLVQTQEDLKASQDDLKNLDARFSSLRKQEQKLRIEAERLLADKNQLQLDKNQLQTEKDRLLADRNKLLADQAALMKQKDDLESDKQQLLGDKKALLGDKTSLIADKNSLLSEREALTRNQNALVSDKQALIAEKQALMAEKQALMAEKQALVSEKQNLTAQKNALVGEKQALVGEKKALMADKQALAEKARLLNGTIQRLQQQLKEMQEQQSNLMNSLASAFAQSKAQGVRVDPKKGKIVLKSEILFESGKSDLTARGKKELQKVAQALNQVIFQPQFKSLIEGIMIEGHTSSRGASGRNWDLSSQRALNSVRHLLTLDEIKRHPKRYKSLLFAGAFGENRPILRKGKEDSNASRRIEIRILFNHSQTKRFSHDLEKLSTFP